MLYFLNLVWFEWLFDHILIVGSFFIMRKRSVSQFYNIKHLLTTRKNQLKISAGDTELAEMVRSLVYQHVVLLSARKTKSEETTCKLNKIGR